MMGMGLVFLGIYLFVRFHFFSLTYDWTFGSLSFFLGSMVAQCCIWVWYGICIAGWLAFAAFSGRSRWIFMSLFHAHIL
jgi:hypothetical protein